MTGASGFVGQTLEKILKKSNYSVTLGTREIYGDLSKFTEWRKVLKEHSVVIHLAARVHIMQEKSKDPLEDFREINVRSTLNLAKEAKKVGIKKFIFISSIKVNGEKTFEKPFWVNDEPMPLDSYGISKLEAEIELMKLHEKGVFEVVIIRPPLIYGKGVKANFEKLMWLVKKDLPIPFGLVNNKRSLVSVLNLCDLIIHCINHPNAGGEIFLVSDDRDYSLKDMIIEMSKVLNKTPHLIPIPVSLMKFTAGLLGKKAYADRLFGNLHVDISKTKKLLDWKPKYNFVDTFK